MHEMKYLPTIILQIAFSPRRDGTPPLSIVAGLSKKDKGFLLSLPRLYNKTQEQV